jgi:hypothetical protein
MVEAKIPTVILNGTEVMKYLADIEFQNYFFKNAPLRNNL